MHEARKKQQGGICENSEGNPCKRCARMQARAHTRKQVHTHTITNKCESTCGPKPAVVVGQVKPACEPVMNDWPNGFSAWKTRHYNNSQMRKREDETRGTGARQPEGSRKERNSLSEDGGQTIPSHARE